VVALRVLTRPAATGRAGSGPPPFPDSPTVHRSCCCTASGPRPLMLPPVRAWLAIGRLATGDVWRSLAAVLPPVFCESRAVARFFRTVRVIANLSNSRFTPGGWLGSSLQVVEGSSGYFALGYLLYVAECSYTT
jgi:hypothetical protein